MPPSSEVTSIVRSRVLLTSALTMRLSFMVKERFPALYFFDDTQESKAVGFRIQLAVQVFPIDCLGLLTGFDTIHQIEPHLESLDEFLDSFSTICHPEVFL